MINKKIVEVNKWLKDNKNYCPFASNKFEREEFEKFIKDLEDLGIKNIMVTGILEEPDRIKEEGGPYADTLYIDLPHTETELKLAFVFIMKKQPDECWFTDNSLTTLRLWWD